MLWKGFDITDSKKAQSLSESIQKIASIGGWELNIGTQETIWTKETYRIHGISEDVPTNKIMGISFYAKHDQPRLARYIEECCGGKSFRDTFEFVDAEGRHKWVEVSGYPYLDSTGKVGKILGTFQDVSVREEQIRQLNRLVTEVSRYRTWVENAREGVWEINREWKTTYVNPMMAEMLGYTPEEVLGRSVFDFMEPSWQQRARNIFFEQQKSGLPKNYEFMFSTKSNRDLWVNISSVPVRDSSGQVQSYLAMVSNIDALKQREWQFEALVQSLDDLVLEIDEDLRLTKVWTQDETKLLRPKIQLIGSSVLELLGQDGTAMLRQALEGLSDHKRATSIEYFHVAHNRHFKLKLSLQKRFGSKRFFTIVQSDITHEKSVQADKDRISNEISQFFEVTLEMLAIIGFEGQFKKINPQWGKVLGYAESELQNTFFIDFVHPDDLAMTIAVLAKIRSGISIQSFENRYRAKDGSYRILNWSSSIDLGTRLIFAAAHDVTESRKGEVRLKQLMAAIDRSALVALTDALGRIIDVNQYFCEVSEYTREEMVGRDLSILNSGAHSKEFYRQLWSTIASGKPWTGQIENKAKSGKRFFVQSVISPIVDVTGGQTKYLGIYLDVTKQVESERQLSEAQSLASLGSWHLERVTSHLTWSAELYHIYEIDPAAPGLLENYRNCISPQDFSRLEGAIHCAFETGKGFSLDHKILLEGGSRIKWVRCLGEPELDFDKVVIAVRGTYQDITKLTLSEQSLQLEKAKTIQNAKLASLGEMSAGIAHEINNPLAIIAGTVQSLPKFLSDPEKLRKKIEIIEKSAERIAKIVNGLRKFSRTSDRPDRKHCRIDRIIEETLIMTAAKAHRHLTQVEVLGSEEAWILCDEIEIEQVLINLINNAIDAVKTSDQRWVQISLKKEASMTVVLVRDSGKGLPKEVKERLFQPFFTTKPVGEGTGLGLSIARGILKEHDASLMLLEDDPHTCFEIRFQPIVDVPRAA